MTARIKRQHKVLILAGCAVGLAGLLGLSFFGRPAFRRFQEDQSIQRARRFMAVRDYGNASLSARRVLELNPANLNACGILAELAQIHNSPSLVDWRRRIAELDPAIGNKLLLAAAIIRSEPPPFALAAQILKETRQTGTNLASYHLVSAEMALRLGNNQLAASHLERAVLLEPANDLHRLNLSVLRLQSTNTASVENARATLESLRTNTHLSHVALRSLIADRLRCDDFKTAERLSLTLLADPRANLEDRLQHLTILHHLESQELRPVLFQVQQEAATNANALYLACAWMIGHGSADEALAWVTNCPASIRAQPPAPLAMADCFIATKNWPGLELFLQGENWGELEFLRFAFLARAAQEQKQPLGIEMRWRSAVHGARGRLDALLALLQMARDWVTLKAREDLLREIIQRFPREEWAARELTALRSQPR